MKFQIPSGAVLAAALLHAPHAEGESSASPQSVLMSGTKEGTVTSPEISLPENNSSNAQNVLKIIVPKMPEWTSKEEGRFLKLAEADALGTINSADKQHLDKLSSLRYNLKTPRSGEQVLLEYQQRKLTSDLIQALEKYVTFQKSTNRQIHSNAEAEIYEKYLSKSKAVIT